MKVLDIMTAPLITISVDCPVSRIAARMDDHGIGALPVVQDGRLAGIVTDRDLVVRVISGSGFASTKTAQDIMTPGAFWCRADHSVETLAALMGDHQVRRLPVLDGRDRLVGMVSLGDIAEHVSERLAGEALGEIVEDR
ncbi:MULTISPECIES: CBS domain-containing protein [Paracoccaceae]|jgi:CBS domain-containing protein|uniref:CBS domain-containing protein n=1 Tax=Rhodobacterales TaxID=204455 RepID=UPI001B0C76F6|nr:CBS domain-containing protein [Boseongicola sp. H5]MBO6604516.1 CBS domain-containing protein [Roseicyclus sp.]MBO6625651.1 CBS domain-containing protein [Roseicyclus sp.]MBO6921705.1 CBS domain-containing protein [Roseicyclus sp.]